MAVHVAQNRDNNTLTAIPGLAVGHATDLDAATGCTVVLCQAGAAAGIEVRGASPGTRETDLLQPGRLVDRVNAVVLTGGSAFGLDAAGGVMRWLEEREVGYPTPGGPIPIVPAMVLFDLQIGRSDVRPTGDWGYAAANAATADPVEEGCVGAGAGASSGKVLGPRQATKTGLGSVCLRASDGVLVGALVATNAFGNIVDPGTGRILAGARLADGTGFANAEEMVMEGRYRHFKGNTTLAVVATNVPLNKEQANRVADMAQDGLARAIRPAHTMYDGDTVIALSTLQPDLAPADVNQLGIMAMAALAQAIARSATQASALAGLPSRNDLPFAR